MSPYNTREALTFLQILGVEHTVEFGHGSEQQPNLERKVQQYLIEAAYPT